MSTTSWQGQAVPAQLSFLAIYNPSLGTTDETFREQVVFHYSRAAHGARTAAKKSERADAAGDDAARAEENEKLKRIGLAQGMVDFAKTFSDGAPVDSVETEKSRLVLRELEQGWWILASIDLTSLPYVSTVTADSATKGSKSEEKPKIEYSSREVGSPALLIEQLRQAHFIFTLHHGPSLSALYARLTREGFCSTLKRFWTRFCRDWDVLLSGNPAADVFSGLKVASGGELGFGVGEEEWGSGEREVIEDLARRTEGLVDVVVSKFGEPEPSKSTGKSAVPEIEGLPWLGGGNEPLPSDGVVFSGIGTIARPSARNISLWMRQIYTSGEYAHGVGDNPWRERRKRRRHNPREHPVEANGSAPQPNERRAGNTGSLQQDLKANKANKQIDAPVDPATVPDSPENGMHDKTASHDHPTDPADKTPHLPFDRPAVPPPIVSAGDQSLGKAPKNAVKRTTDSPVTTEASSASSTLGIPDVYMKYLTLGISELAKQKQPPAPKGTSAPGSETLKATQGHSKARASKTANPATSSGEPSGLAKTEPIRDFDALQDKISRQKHLENQGYFLIGLTGELNEVLEVSADQKRDDENGDDSGGSRTILRTVYVEVPPYDESAQEGDNIRPSPARMYSGASGDSSNLDGTNFRRLRVLVYIHRPFIYCFLFEQRTSSLQYPSFYRELHRNLLPIHKPLLSSTNVKKIAQRIEAAHVTPTEDKQRIANGKNTLPPKDSDADRPVYDLIYDPRTLTLHTSIPNIPRPGTPAAEGLLSSRNESAAAGWSRVEALSVHSQILNTLSSVAGKHSQLERTSKTARGWWVVWLRVPPSASASATILSSDGKTEADSNDTLCGGEIGQGEERQSALPGQDMHRTAFLVRKSSDAATASSKSGVGSHVASGLFSSLAFTATTDADVDRASVRSGFHGLETGIGVDARRYVEGLLSLNR